MFQEMKKFLLQGQQDALLLTANGIATILNDRSELFNPATGVPEVLGNKDDLYAHRLDKPVQLDGVGKRLGSVTRLCCVSHRRRIFLR